MTRKVLEKNVEKQRERLGGEEAGPEVGRKGEWEALSCQVATQSWSSSDLPYWQDTCRKDEEKAW